MSTHLDVVDLTTAFILGSKVTGSSDLNSTQIVAIG